jgi:hypothetical protein
MVSLIPESAPGHPAASRTCVLQLTDAVSAATVLALWCRRALRAASR